MVQVSYPGVYIKEVPSGVRTITGVSTSIAAFFGRTAKGPLNKAVRCFNLSDFNRAFGGAHPKSDLAQSVRLFFANGGTDCFVVRVAHGAERASVVLQSLAGENVLQITAKSAGEWANTVRLIVDYDPSNPYDSFNLRVQVVENGTVAEEKIHRNLSMNPDSPRFASAFVAQSSDLVEVELHADMGDPGKADSHINDIDASFAGYSQSRRQAGNLDEFKTLLDELMHPADGVSRHKFDISVNGNGFQTVDLLPWTGLGAMNVGDICQHITDRIEGAVAPATVDVELSTGTNYIKIISTSGDKSNVRVQRAPSNDIAAALMLGTEQRGIEPSRWSNFRPAPSASLIPFGAPGGNPRMMEEVDVIATTVGNLEQNEITSITIDGVEVMLDPTSGFNLQTTEDGTDQWVQNDPVPDSPNGNMDGIREKLGIIARAITAKPGLPYRAEVWGYHLAIITTSDSYNTTPSTIITGENVFDEGQKLNASAYPLAGTASRTSSAYVEDAEGRDGDDGEAPEVDDYLGNGEDQTGMHALDPVDLFNLMVIPDDEGVTQATMNQLWGPASTYCEDHRAFLLIDPPASWTRNERPEVVQNTDLVKDLRDQVVNDHSAVFYPRLRYIHQGITKTIGPSGAIAGLMARIDSTRGVWKAAAGLEADLRGIVGLTVDLTDRENGVLNKIGVNCLRAFPNGFVSWGARTMDGSDDIGSEWKYIPIRRLALFLSESLFRGTQWVVFESNDEPLWANIRLNLNAFMLGLFREGAFQGSTPGSGLLREV